MRCISEAFQKLDFSSLPFFHMHISCSALLNQRIKQTKKSAVILHDQVAWETNTRPELLIKI